MHLRLSLAAPLLLLAGPVLAQDAGDDPYADCVALEDDSERLACFDATYAEQRVVIAEREVREEERREEVARMLSGAAITEEARAQAARLIEEADA